MTPTMALTAAALLACLAASVDGFSTPALVSFSKAPSLSRFASAAAGRPNVLAPLSLGQPCARRARFSPAMSADAAAATQPAASPFAGKKALIFTWFYAQPKEIELVKRIYKRKGFDEVVVQESIVKEIATPRGWYKTYIKFAKGDGPSEELRQLLGREYDVVHCMSGGFLNLGLVLSVRHLIPLRFKYVVMDSTPILPQPKSFVRFARAYMQEHGLSFVNKVVPEPVHTGYQSLRWQVGAIWVRGKHKFQAKFSKNQTRKLGEMPADVIQEMDSWTRWATHTVMMDRYDEMCQSTINLVFQTQGLKAAVFLYNPKDPFINPDDVARCVSDCKASGVPVEELRVENKHIETLFRKPNILFNALSGLVEKEEKAEISA